MTENRHCTTHGKSPGEVAQLDQAYAKICEFNAHLLTHVLDDLRNGDTPVEAALQMTCSMMSREDYTRENVINLLGTLLVEYARKVDVP